jgi:hypothetical protein
MRTLVLIILLGLIAGTGGCNRRGIFFATAHLIDPEGRPVAEAAFVQEEGEVGVRIILKGWGLPPGVHTVGSASRASSRTSWGAGRNSRPEADSTPIGDILRSPFPG